MPRVPRLPTPVSPPRVRLVRGDCLDVFRGVRGLGAIVADPPAGIGFMGRSWDKDRGGRSAWIAYWAERFAVAKDACDENAVALIWALPRTSHWTATALEDAGWFIQDTIHHTFGQGWPKDKRALKPAHEVWILARKGRPLLDIDACRVERDVLGERAGSWPTNALFGHADGCEPAGTRSIVVRRGGNGGRGNLGTTFRLPQHARSIENHSSLRPGTAYMGKEELPAYLCAVGCDCGASWLAPSGDKAPLCECGRAGWWACPVAELDAQSGILTSGARTADTHRANTRDYRVKGGDCVASLGGASRFFPRFGYYGKAPGGERHAGCDELYWKRDRRSPFGFVRVSREEHGALPERERARGCVHPTVKRISLMRWLHTLTGAKRIGDLCAGSGSGAIAAHLDGVDWIGSEVCMQSLAIAEARLAWWRSLSPADVVRFSGGKGLPKLRAPNAPSELAAAE